ncbi:MAG TPA: YbjQ family protein [Pseudogracilibacillus sp.]|nr:YbjQ family protein [Pseudogracilibacillus sp.]
MIVVTTNDIPGKKIDDVKGLVQGSTVKAKHMGRDIGASFKTLVGGEIKGYSDLMKEAREEALERMKQEAEKIGANAIIGMRYQTSQVMNSAAEVIAYGTAVYVE